LIYPITRIYHSYAQAIEAARDLQQAGFKAGEISLVTPAAGQDNAGQPSARSVDDIAAEIAAGKVLKADARHYAEHVKRGQSLVTVRAPFGTGGKAIFILDALNPVATDIERRRHSRANWDEAAPLSSALRIPVLSRRGTPFSTAWGLKLLSNRAAPFSSLFGLPTLSKDRRGPA
jgi:hypothetical protein